MARPLRVEFSGALYRVTSRGDSREAIFLSDGNRRMLLDVAAGVWQRFNWAGHAHCLMTNPYHLLVETPDANLPKGMRQLKGIYTQRFNHTYTDQAPASRQDDCRVLSRVPQRNDAILAPYRSCGYTLPDIGDYYVLHYSHVSKIVQAADLALGGAKRGKREELTAFFVLRPKTGLP